MKKILFIILFAAFFIIGCENQQEQKTDLIVFAAASMTETLEEIKPLFENKYPDINLIYTFDSSGTLKNQISEGASADVFISASKKQIDQLIDENLILKEDTLDILENKIVIVSSENSNIEINSVEDLLSDEINTIALGNSDVPVGDYSEKLLKNIGIWDQIYGKVTFGSNVKEVTTWIKEGVADVGIIYSTDAVSEGLNIQLNVEENLLDEKIIYPIGILENSNQKENSKKFLEFLKTEESKEIFENVGFVVLD